MNARRLFLSLTVVCCAPLCSALEPVALETKPADPYFEQFVGTKAPAPGAVKFQIGDRLAICGDSITEQKMYSRIIETYLTVCHPELAIEARQYGWSGETAGGFLKRMQNDCLRYGPTVATTCYGMNDHRYKPYAEEIGQSYRENMGQVVDNFTAAGVRVILGSAGTVNKMPTWVKNVEGTVDDLNINLGKLRDIDIELAAEKKTGFADVFWPMLVKGFEAKQKWGQDYMLAGKDGVHPGWAGHVVMAYAFLHASAVSGEIGKFVMMLKDGQTTVSSGHEIAESGPGTVTLLSSRYPFCATGAVESDGSIRSGMELVPFNHELNRFELQVPDATAPKYQVTWGTATKVYTGAELKAGVNLAADFVENPFSEAFEKVSEAIGAKQLFETTSMKKNLHSEEAKTNMDGIVARDEIEHATFVKKVQTAFAPVQHTITVAETKE